ncbi:MAG TPA: GNAT family N-acetyltransferase [Dehalococcoidia bacterium]|nr:GNAT family N-acetyltransferase [Dehalococcoidia bacterium]
MIRLAERRHREAVFGLASRFATSFEVEQAAFDRAWSRLLVDKDACLLVAEDEGAILGYLLGFRHETFFANGPVGWVEELMVDVARRGQGLGRDLMRYFEGWAAEAGCNLVALATRRADAFYRAIGYEESATYFRKLL